jgi:hypothetical protein
MKIRFLGFVVITFMACCSLSAFAQVRLVQNGKSSSRIVLAPDSRLNRTAANILQRFIKEASTCKLPVLVNVTPRQNDIVLGGTTGATVKDDGFSFSTKGKVVRIAGKENGVVYGAVALLEKYFKIDYWGDHEYSLPITKNIQLPVVSFVENPAFTYRQLQSYALGDSIYKWWYRLEEPNEMFASTYWVHTSDRLLPVSQYGKSHPEYFAFYDGKRHTEDITQLCLTNKEVLNIVVHHIDSIFKKNPTMNTIAFSQNDNFSYCRCDKCAAVDKEEGSTSGTLIRFVNAIAAKFPDKKIVTLAYQYTRKPPLMVKPASNVGIMLCDIECTREVPLTESKSGQDFIVALKDWGKITKNIFLWDYGINFAHYMFPFPNFQVLQDNIQLFKNNNVTMHFSEIESDRGGDFAELRAYIVAKLMWNDQLNVDSLMHHFLYGYYGKAAPYIKDYIELMKGALLGSGKELGIFESPMNHLDGMFRPALMKRYNELFNKAELAAAYNTMYLKRVQRSRLPLQYMTLEIARKEGFKDYNSINETLKLFEQRTKEFCVTTLREVHYTPAQYCSSYREELEKHR